MYAEAIVVHKRQVRHSVRSGLSAQLYTAISAAMPSTIAQNSVVMNDGFVSRNTRSRRNGCRVALVVEKLLLSPGVLRMGLVILMVRPFGQECASLSRPHMGRNVVLAFVTFDRPIR